MSTLTYIVVRRCTIFTKDDLGVVARFTPSHLAQNVIYRSSDNQIRAQLIDNLHLDPLLWDRLYKSTINPATLEDELRRRTELPALLTNAPTPEHLPDIYRALELRSWAYPTLKGTPLLEQEPLPGIPSLSTKDCIAQSLTPYLDNLGATGWELFIHLLPEWAGSIDSLLGVITSTTLVH